MPYIENLDRNRRVKNVLIAILIIVAVGVLAWLGFKFFGNKPIPAPENSAGSAQPAVPSRELLESVTVPQESGSQEENKQSGAVPPPPEDVIQNITAPETKPEAPNPQNVVPKDVMDSLNAK